MADIFISIGVGVFALCISIAFILLFALIKEDCIIENLEEESILFGCAIYIILMCMVVIPSSYIDIKNHPEKYGIQFIDEQGGKRGSNILGVTGCNIIGG